MKQSGKDAQVRQSAVNFVRDIPMNPSSQWTSPFFVIVKKVYSERLTCDVQTLDGQDLFNVPVETKAGLIDDKPYGTVDLPSKDDLVIVDYASYGNRNKVIKGTVVPYLTNEFKDDAVNSDSKAYTKKLLEEDKPNTYKKIFKSGTTLEVEEDGGVILEQPNGTYILLDIDPDDDSNDSITIEDHHGNIVIVDNEGISAVDVNDNSVNTDSDGIVITDTNDNSITMDSNGILMEDANGNDVTMDSTSVSFNGNLEVLR
jgi:hypothetical protein